MEVVDVSDEEVKSLAQSILIRYGIDFTCYEPKSFRRRIIRIMNLYNFKSTFELWGKFLHDRNFVFTFMNDISVGMTSMFRDPPFWKTLKGILQRKYSNSREIKIWHAGCSTGEEVYSMGILLKELQMSMKAKAIATDINQEAIAIAKDGLYHKIKMLENERQYAEYNRGSTLSNYFQSDGKMAHMSPELIQHVSFSYHNLVTDPVMETNFYDIIFCRNVMIYFDNSAKEKILSKFYSALKPNGLLIIGFFDTMLPVINQKQFDYEDEEAKIFAKQSVPASVPFNSVREVIHK
ncbi:chemotaxis protein R [Cytophagales bacterium WSM2-2]|nr:chemotaxis protein R [Cytophagales bacterium WSM2-2]